MRQIALLALILLVAVPASAEDMREVARKARADRESALEEIQEAEERILADREALTAEVARLEAEVANLEERKNQYQATSSALKEKEKELSGEWSDRELEFREIVGTVRTVARDLETVLMNSQLTAADPDRIDRLAPMLEKGHFPGMDDLAVMTGLFFKEMRATGEVVRKEGAFTGRSGAEEQGRILTIGPFTAAYQTDRETGFLKYSEQSRRLYALSSLPSRGVRRSLKRYMGGGEDTVYIDLSAGGALRQITQREGLVEHIRSGGPIVWPILLIGLVALGFVVERALYLRRVHGNTDRVMGRVNELAARGCWQECEETVKTDKKNWPVYNVLAAGLAARDEDRETFESILQESILRELPHLERFLPTLGILGAIAPLLGLLGTVTGMINTFHVITLYGTGDPRMMSGGISEALVTTEIGLAIAIPIMLLHTILNRRVDQIVSELEEMAVALTNIIQKGTTHTKAPQEQ